MKVLFDEIYDEEFIIEQFLIYSEQQLNEYYIKLFSSGITKKDLYDLINLEGNIRFTIDDLNDKLIKYNNEMKDIENAPIDFCSLYRRGKYEELNNKKEKLLYIISNLNDIDDKILNIILDSKYELYSYGLISEDAIEYIGNNTSLLHLVYTNNTHPKIRQYSINSHMFLCQFHKEKTPSFGITSDKNLSHCFGCGFGGNQFTYIMNYENYSFIDTFYFLAEIYLIKIPNNPFKNNPNVEKYRNVLLSDEYMNFINTSIKRVSNEKALKWYKKHIENIERIKNNCIDENIKDNYKNKQKVYKLEMPTFNN